MPQSLYMSMLRTKVLCVCFKCVSSLGKKISAIKICWGGGGLGALGEIFTQARGTSQSTRYEKILIHANTFV